MLTDILTPKVIHQMLDASSFYCFCFLFYSSSTTANGFVLQTSLKPQY